MTKIMLVEDDRSLREIYGVRLLAEGYDIVSAGDGEEALAVAIKERPSLIISDVMMPKISGFDMLDILRSTTETRNVKVIMMTALSSDEQRARGEQLGADRYLVKSQVGIEDVVRVVHEVLNDSAADDGEETSDPTTTITPQPAPAPAPMSPVAPTTAPNGPPAPPVRSGVPSIPTRENQPEPMRPAVPQAPAPVPITPPSPRSASTPEAPSSRNRTIAPLNDPFTNKVNLSELFDKEMAREGTQEEAAVSTADQERNAIAAQLDTYERTPEENSGDAGPSQSAALPQWSEEQPIANGRTFTPPTPEALPTESQTREDDNRPTQPPAPL